MNNTYGAARPEKIVSIHMQSNRPGQFSQFLDRIEATTDRPEEIEVIVKIDDTDVAMNALLPQETSRRRLSLKFISTPLPDGFYGLWRSMDQMLAITDPRAYFVVNLNDEMYFETQSWDAVLHQQVGRFTDDIFRLRTSVLNRHRNYYDVWQCGFAPDTSSFITQKWLRISGGWTPCTGPETFQQCVAFYLGYHQRFSSSATCRDIAIDAIAVAGEGANNHVADHRKLRLRHSGAVRQWFILMSHQMQQEASRRARLLQAHALMGEFRLENVEIIDRSGAVEIWQHGNRLKRLEYKLNPLKIGIRNFGRLFNYHYYGGGGDDHGWNPIWNSYLVLRLWMEGTQLYGTYWRMSQEPRPAHPTMREYLARVAILVFILFPKRIVRILLKRTRSRR